MILLNIFCIALNFQAMAISVKTLDVRKSCLIWQFLTMLEMIVTMKHQSPL